MFLHLGFFIHMLLMVISTIEVIIIFHILVSIVVILMLAIFHVKMTVFLNILIVSLVMHLLLNFFILLMNIDKLFKQWDSSVRVLLTLWDHVTGQKLYNFAKSHLLIVIGVNLVKKELNLIFVVNNIHLFDKHTEFIFADTSVLISINFLVYFSEFEKESFMFLKLEVKDNFLELCVLQFSIICV